MRILLTLEYDGTGLIGFQKNEQGPSVQSLVENAILEFCGEQVDVVGCGRTDAGVHALAMPAHFDIAKEETPDTIRAALNFYLRESSVAVLSAERVADDFHARFSATARHYRYDILNRRSPSKLLANRAWWVPRPLDMDKMISESKKLLGQHDFNSFRSTECQAKSPVKTLDAVRIEKNGDMLSFYFSARSFLHHQVRNMVGTLVDIGLGKPMDINSILDAKNRTAAGQTAPACGLYFVSADYAKGGVPGRI
ncbi:MAG: tRNA pseudouridine(38-40) synthase TruA [Rickettsiales bacterium]|jgi:tRNA pseudouridine38-40 synthase|nr:tRNA pseudouridine(38-40) synthase TruA [Rickettsiales bacterium]